MMIGVVYTMSQLSISPDGNEGLGRLGILGSWVGRALGEDPNDP